MSRGDLGLAGSGEELGLTTGTSIEGDGGEPADLTPEQIERVRDHIRHGHVRKEPLCKECVEAEGVHKKHLRHGTKRSCVAHIDVCGPLPMEWQGHRYILVLGLRLGEAPVIINARSMATRAATEVVGSLRSMCEELESMDIPEFPLGEERRIRTIQSDRAREFEGRMFQEFCHERAYDHTVNTGYNPASNGTAEKIVGMIKMGLRRLLVATRFPVESWGDLLRYLVQCHFLGAVGREQTSLPPGTLVIARNLRPRGSLEPRGS